MQLFTLGPNGPEKGIPIVKGGTRKGPWSTKTRVDHLVIGEFRKRSHRIIQLGNRDFSPATSDRLYKADFRVVKKGTMLAIKPTSLTYAKHAGIIVPWCSQLCVAKLTRCGWMEWRPVRKVPPYQARIIVSNSDSTEELQTHSYLIRLAPGMALKIKQVVHKHTGTCATTYVTWDQGNLTVSQMEADIRQMACQ